jgi:hypothetical protein
MKAADQLRGDSVHWPETQYYLSKLADRPFDTLHPALLSSFQQNAGRSQIDCAYMVDDARFSVLLYHGRAWADRSEAYLHGKNMAPSEVDEDSGKAFGDRPLAERLAIVRTYPPLLESLALLFDLTFEIYESALQGKIIRAFPANGTLKVEFGASPWTQIDAAGFFPRFVPNEVENGFLAIKSATPKYTIGGFEVDAAVLRDVHGQQHAIDLRANNQSLSAAQDETSLPISGGVSLLRSNRIVALNSRKNRFSTAQMFTAESLIGSLEPQIWIKSKTKKFLSLSERTESYQISGLPDVKPQRVTVGVRTAARKDPDAAVHPAGSSSPPYQLHDSLFRWDGWHIGADHPLNPDKPAAPPTPLPFSVTITAPPTPALRFGHSYQLRVRALDLAGFPMTDSADTPEVLDYDYLRSDPVEPGIVLLSESLPFDRYPGEALERMVVRSTDCKKFRTDFCTRVIAPPRVGLIFAERHGVFDDRSPFKTGSYAQVQLRDSEFVSDTASGLPISDDGKREDPEHCTYLPDPMAKFIVADLVWNGKSIPLNSEDKISIYDLGDWPEADFVKVVLSKADTVGGQWRDEGDGHTLHVWLPKGTEAELRLSCVMDDDDFEHHVVSCWASASTDADSIRDFVLSGKHALVTPPRNVALVHALEIPPHPPVIRVNAIQQTLNSRTSKVRLSAEVDRGLVSSTDITAEWKDCGVGSRGSLVGKAKVGTVRDQNDADLEFSLPTTMHREVSYVGVCSSRFAEYFQDPPRDARKGPPSTQDVYVRHLSTARPEALDVAYIMPMFQVTDEDDTLNRPRHSYLRQRKGGLLRIYVNGAMCSSGPGEKMGVVAFDQRGQLGYPLARASGQWSNENPGTAGTPLPADYVAKTAIFNSIWAGDNLWPSRVATAGPASTDFLNAESIVYGATLGELEGAINTGEPRYPLTLISYSPQFDPNRQLSWCDIQLTVPSSFAFLRLAMVRYQPNSLRFADCSKIVYADYISLPPTRSLIIMRAPRKSGLKNTIYMILLGGQDERSGEFANSYSVTLDRSEGLGRSGIWWRPLRAPDEAEIQPLPHATLDSILGGNVSGTSILAGFSVRLINRGGDLRLGMWESENYDTGPQQRRRLVYADNLYIPDDEF